MSSSGRVTASYVNEDQFLVHARSHEVVVDQPQDAGGSDSGATPTELFVGSLVACVGFFAERFLRRNEVEVKGLSVSADFALSDERPSRVETIEINLVVPAGIPPRLLEATRRVVENCTIHNTLSRPPAITISLIGNVTTAS